MRFVSLLALAFVLGCGPGLAGDAGSETGTDATTSGDGDGDGDGTGDGTGDGDGEPDDGDGEPGDGDSDCESPQVMCEDGTCQWPSSEWPCCGHGGPCQAGCEPQMVASTMDTCLEPQYAWTGLGCGQICGCEGPDCGSLYASVGACLAAHEPDCGSIGLDTCPFEMQLGPGSITGMTSYGPNEFTVGAFGQIFGEGPVNLSIAIGTDFVALGNHLWSAWNPPPSADVLVVWGGNPTPGEHEVYVSVAIPLSRGAMGTLTITDISVDGDFVDHGLWATLEVAEGEWNLSGEFAIPGCQRLEQHLP